MVPAGCDAMRPRRPLAAAVQAEEAAVEEDRAIEATGVGPTASRREAGRTAAALPSIRIRIRIRAAVPAVQVVSVPVASDPPAAAEAVVGEEAAAAHPTAAGAEAAAVGEEAAVVASVPAAAAAAVAVSVPNATHLSASGTAVPCPPPAGRSPLAVCPAVPRPPLPCPIDRACTAAATTHNINGLSPLVVERVRTNNTTAQTVRRNNG